VLPFGIQVVDRVLDRRVESVVVLRDHEDERIGPLDGGTPVFGVLVNVLAEPRVLRLVEHRQVDLGEIDQLDVEAAMGDRALVNPAGDRRADPARAGTGDDDLQDWVGHRPTLEVHRCGRPGSVPIYRDRRSP